MMMYLQIVVVFFFLLVGFILLMRVRRDNIKRRTTEKILRANEEKLRMIVDKMACIVWTVDRNFRFTTSFGAQLEKVGLKSEQVIGQTLSEFFKSTDQKEKVVEAHQRALKGEPFCYDYSWKNRIFESHVEPLEDKNKNIIGVIGLAIDVTDRIQAEEKRRKAEEEAKGQERILRSLFNALPDLIFRLNREGVFLDYRTSKEVPLLMKPENFVGKKVSDVLPIDVVLKSLQAIKEAFETGKVQSIEYDLPVEGRIFSYEARFVLSGPDEVFVLIRDMTARKRLEREILEISGREQKRIGQDLHDGICQHLTGISLMSKSLSQKLRDENLARSEEACDISGLINQGIDQVKALARGLYPVELEENGLIPAFQEMASSLESLYAVSCQFHYDHVANVQDRSIALHLYRITQEAVNNAIRHGMAKNIAIKLGLLNGQSFLSVRDDGCGLPKDYKGGKGMGLHIMQYRSSTIGGTLDIRAMSSGGTEVVCTFQNKMNRV